MSASVSTVRPSGFSSSLAILLSSLFGRDADGAREAGGAGDEFLISRATARTPPTGQPHGVVDAGHVGQVDVDLVDAAVLDHGRHLSATAALKRREKRR